ncbi:MAG TPA: CotH kinase family protein, partial [Verrucomicrobiae bacterium]|nr:CotH kinase family protein [Verrucomicrobiae bacterium]
MTTFRHPLIRATAAAACATIFVALAQPPDGPFEEGGFGGPPPFADGPGGFGGPHQKQDLVEQFDRDGDHMLNAAERKAAYEFLQKEGGGRGFRRGPGGFRGPGGPRGEQAPVKPNAKLAPSEVKSYANEPLYAPLILRTFFIEFEDADWEKQLAAFKNTDIEIPAKLTVDGKVYNDVGVHFHGMSSFMSVSEGRKRSLVLSLDFMHKDQAIGGYRTIELLNSHEDPTFLRTVLSYQIERDYVPAPKANFGRVVINGENWGVYVNAQAFNKEFIKDWCGSTKGNRWKVPGSPGGQGSLKYLGDDARAYRGIYELKSKENPRAWADLAKLCKVLNETPADQLEKSLAPLLDIDGALKFLALENALVNNDGYWIRTSDYALYEDTKGQFHVFPRDSNETFLRPESPGGMRVMMMGPGGQRGPGGPGFRGPGEMAGPGMGGPRMGGMRGGPGMELAREMFSLGDENHDQQLSAPEFNTVAETWFDRLDPDKTGAVRQEQFVEHFGSLMTASQADSSRDNKELSRNQPSGRGGELSPARFIGPNFFAAMDVDKNGALTRAEAKVAFAKWFTQWDVEKTGALSEENLLAGMRALLPPPHFVRMGGPGRGPGGGSNIKG